MYNHAPKDYVCPMCLLANGKGNDVTNQQDVVYKNSLITAFISGKWWKNNPGHVLIIPNKHMENVYDLEEIYGHEIQDFGKEVSIALKEVYHCDGVSFLQHNEPVGNQEVFHYHMHVLPRYKNDEFYDNFKNTRWVEQKERLPYVEKLRNYFNDKNE